MRVVDEVVEAVGDRVAVGGGVTVSGFVTVSQLAARTKSLVFTVSPRRKGLGENAHALSSLLTHGPVRLRATVGLPLALTLNTTTDDDADTSSAKVRPAAEECSTQ